MKLLLVSTSGGHFSTMRRLESFWSQHQRVWITDHQKDTECLIDQEKFYWLPYQAPRDWLAFLLNLPLVFRITWHEKPDVIISTGASLAVGFALAAKLYNIQYIYIESISRSKELSLTGKLVYYFCDQFYVQWPQLSNKYPKATFKGTA